jgi:hypothetical protein
MISRRLTRSQRGGAVEFITIMQITLALKFTSNSHIRARQP